MKNLLAQLKTEDWVIVLAGVAILALALLFPAGMPAMPKTLAGGDAWLEAGCMFAFLFVLTCLCMAVLGRPVKGIFGSLLAIFAVALAAQAVASVPLFKDLGLESVFFSVIFGLAVSNFFRVPAWLKPAIQSEFYIKIGIVCLGATILFGEILHSGVYALAQAFIVVFLVWYFAFWVSRRMKVDDEMATMHVMPWLAKLVLPALLGDPKVVEEVAGAWMGGTIDTTGAVVASGALLGETAEQTAVIVKSSQNVLLGLAAFVISLYWSYRGREGQEKPSAGVIWDRFPKFVVGFVAVSLLFSLFFDGGAGTPDAVVRGTAKNFSNTLFSIAFVCIGLETRFSEIFSKENRNALWAFLSAQTFNIVVTFIVAFLLFGVLKPMWA